MGHGAIGFGAGVELGQIAFLAVVLCVVHFASRARAWPKVALGTGYAWHALTLQTSKFHLLPANQPYATLYKSYSEDFGQLEDIVVVVQSPAVEVSTAYAARLAPTGPLTNMIWKSMPDLQPSFDQFAKGLKAKAEGAGP